MAKVVFSFRGKFQASDVAALQQRIEESIRALGLPEECEVTARFQKDGLGQVEVSNVPPDVEEQVRTSVSAELVAAHEAVIQEE